MSTVVEIKSYRKEVEQGIYNDIDRKMNKLGVALVNKIATRLDAKSGAHPWYQTGNLKSSIRFELEGSDKEKTLVVGTNEKYGAALEFGHPQHPGQYVHKIHRRLVKSWVPPYPWLFPTIEANKDLIIDTLGGKAGFNVVASGVIKSSGNL